MANKPVKIKRNTSISGKKYQRKVAAKKIFSIIFALGALLALGFFGAPAVVEMINNMKDRPQQIITEPPAEPTPTPGEIIEPTTNPGDAQTDIIIKTNICSYVDVKNLLTEASALDGCILEKRLISFSIFSVVFFSSLSFFSFSSQSAASSSISSPIPSSSWIARICSLR